MGIGYLYLMPFRPEIIKLVPAVVMVVLTAWLSAWSGSEPDSNEPDVISNKIEEQVFEVRQDLKRFADGQPLSSDETLVMFEQGVPVKWSTSVRFPLPLPPVHDTLMIRRSPSGVFLDIWHSLSPDVMVGGIIPLVRYFHLPGGKTIERHHPIFGKDPPNLIFGIQNNVRAVTVSKTLLFGLADRKQDGHIRGWSSWFWLFISACALAWLARLVYHVYRGAAVPILMFSAVMLVAVRLFLLQNELPGTTGEIPMLDPAVFASSTWNNNAVNFLINQVFILAYSLLFFVVAGRLPIRGSLASSAWIRYFWLVVASAGLVLAFHYPFLALRTVFRDSVIPMDITRSIQFTSARMIVIIAIFTAIASAWILVQPFSRSILVLTTQVFKRRRQQSLILLFILMLVGSWLVAGQIAWEQTGCLFLVLIMLAIRAGLFGIRSGRPGSGVTGMLRIFMLASSLALGVRSMEQSGLRDRMVIFAQRLEEDRDEFGEYLLRELSQQIKKDAYITMAAESPLSDKNRILQKLNQYHLRGYLSKFPKKTGFYNADGVLADGNTPSALSELKNGAIRISGTDSTGGVFRRVRSSTADGLGKSYLVLVPAGMGTIVLVVDMSTAVTNRPWYFRLDDREPVHEMGNEMSYRILSNGQLVFQSEDADAIGIQKAPLSQQVRSDNWNILKTQMADGRLLIVSGPDYAFGRLLTNFSFYLFIALVIFAFIWLMRILFDRLTGRILSYTSRIQVYLAIAFILPLVVTSIAAIRNISLEGEGQVTADHRRQVLALASEAGRQAIPGDGPDRERLIGSGTLPEDGFILYDLNGRRIFSNQPELLESSLMPNLMNPVAIERMRTGLSYTAIREEVAGYAYQGTYAVVKAGIPAVPVAWLHVPFFDHYAAAEQTRIRVMISILPIAALVFIVFLLVSYRMSERLTQPIREVSRSLRRGTLHGIHLRREGQGSDEIGKMMEAYDQMIKGMERSKNELIANQRDADWRNMARQVAHEIRNPLTPIRLKLQWLQRQLKDGVAAPAQASASIDAILKQTDILSGIAGSFSAVAGFPKLEPAAFDLVAETARTIELFQEQSGGSIVLNKPEVRVIVEFDKPFFSRIISNLLLNALQSRSGPVHVEVTIQKAGKKAIISVKDDGEGIDPALGDQIFLPRFTTKTDGSGLGLAIARQGLEQAGGRIWYQSVPGAGSSFYVEMELAEGVNL